MLQSAGLTLDGFSQLVQSRIAPAIGFQEIPDRGILLHQRAPVQVEWMLLDLVENDQDRRVGSEARDQPKPIFGVRVLAAFPAPRSPIDTGSAG